MSQQRLFYVAPDAAHLSARYDAYTGTWKVHVAVSERQETGDLEARVVETYEYLSAEEAADVIAAASLTLLVGPLSAAGAAAGC